MNKKHCPLCGNSIVKKNGHKRGYQMYKCNVCGSQFEGVHRIDKSELYQQYVSDKKTYQELALEHNCSARSVQCWLSQISMSYTPSKPLESVIIMGYSELKRRLHSHNGLTEANKKKFIDGFLKTWGKPSE